MNTQTYIKDTIQFHLEKICELEPCEHCSTPEECDRCIYQGLNLDDFLKPFISKKIKDTTDINNFFEV